MTATAAKYEIERLRDEVSNLRYKNTELQNRLAVLSGGKTDDQIARIKALVASAFGLTVAELESGGRPERIVIPRHVAMALSRESGMTLQDVGVAFNKGHGVVHLAQKTVRNMADTNPAFSHKLEVLRKQVRGE